MSSIKIEKNISGGEQESNFMNAALSIHGEHVVSIAIRMPKGAEKLTQDEIEAKLRADLGTLVEQGYEIEAQVGLNED
ncbi:hypothetical protein [Vibrio crassostreae]|uniref:hypothetical protein n=1 Tax=Vibrio crassostreae TaxID=246167 RepID=UPI001B30445C|nr:hypothetical protein [Vibrio crassostreae]